MEEVQANPGKQLTIEVTGRVYARIPIRTHVITASDKLDAIVQVYAGSLLRAGDTLVISEKMVAITQQRAFPLNEIAPSRLARFLVHFVMKSPHGVGLGSPWTMEMAIREVGAVRIVFAAVVAGVAKLLKIKGIFYRICGANVAAIDGPCDYTLPPYDRCAILGPLRPNEVAQSLSDGINVPVAIVDANDLGVTILGASSGCPESTILQQVLADNPLGQSREQTPLGILRPCE